MNRTEYKYYGVSNKSEILESIFVASDWIEKAKEYKMVWTEKYWNKIRHTINPNETKVTKIEVWKDLATKNKEDIIYAITESHRYWSDNGEYIFRMGGIPKEEWYTSIKQNKEK